ncbi:MAG TPA: hydroxyisourate hydrolase [Gemmatimonadaceae bacterium]|nr:hydroxyisourate hydrolase [Gemmatimonadaceae bacterium]
MISTHVLDTALGRPAAGMPVVLERAEAGEGASTGVLARAATDADGRVRELLPAGAVLAAGTYRLTFETGAYFEALGTDGFYPRVAILFTVRDPTQHHHVPLLLSPFGYATYRGS